ncbi:homeobox protein Hox-B4-like [Cyanistes caeruleus]|uniref:homeobox protein Hox-B4-like n=1 Tax=Cyanistes caeruleus TaxID=156563 RepID=UPI000CDB41F9|nr:homeobox protein Hox-B4-like [Cyanistes caeruleus]
MAMSSFLINSNYVDPKFPPCEEYSHSDYLPNHSPEYYQRHRHDSFHHESNSYEPRSSCKEQIYCPGSGMSPRGHIHGGPGQRSRLPEPQRGRSPSSPPSCSQNPGEPREEPVVYPWMKKVHVSTANLRRPSVGKKAPGVLQETFRGQNNNDNHENNNNYHYNNNDNINKNKRRAPKGEIF